MPHLIGVFRLNLRSTLRDAITNQALEFVDLTLETVRL